MKADGSNKERRTPGPLKRMSAEDSLAIREILAVAWQTIEPEERTQRQLFAALMTELYALRMKGFSFRQIASLLNDSGFSLQPGTVRSYYNEMIAARMDECKKRFDEQMALLRDAQQMTRSADLGHLAGKIVAMRQRNQELVDQRIKAVLSASDVGGLQSANQDSRPQTTPANVKTAKKNAPPTPPKKQPAEVAQKGNESGFGLTDSRVIATGETRSSFFDGGGVADEDSQVSTSGTSTSITPSAGAKREPPSTQKNTLRCCAPKGKDAPPPLERRPGVPIEVYEDGLLEHPAISGLMLTKEQRLYGALLEFINSEDGVVHIETMNQKRFRIKWARPVQPAGSTKDFVQLHQSTLPPNS